jgi:NAD(P)-dependent dehydrogenase (short-subunit alcohol dehydrogenase family)
MTLDGAQVVVVGGSSGIGLATAALARQHGAHVTIAGRSADKLAQAQQALGDVRTVAADIAAEAATQSIFSALDRVDHVMVSAGTLANGRIVDNDLATLRRIVDERIWGLVHVVRHARPRMTDGSITFTSGSLSSRPRPGTAMLTASLAAVEALAPALALELAPVRVNVVTPGLIDTPLLNGAFGSDRETLIATRAAVLPGKRVGTPDEVAQAIVMCMTNPYVNGAVLHIDGGGRYVA